MYSENLVELLKGTKIGPYEVLGMLGAGGMGEVYRALDTRLGRTVAIKVLPAISANTKVLLRFQREAKAISRLNHPHICALYDVGELSSDSNDRHTPRLPYLVLEYLEGESLEDRLKRGFLPIDEVLRFATEIADALDKAHRGQILHRDLKPQNIMITASGAKLLDFGLASFIPKRSLTMPAPTSSSDESSTGQRSRDVTTEEKPLTSTGVVVGTFEYLAPEQIEGKKPDTRTDIFAFGVCLYQMITGRRPFQGSSRASIAAAILEHDPPPIDKYREGTPRSLEWLARTCLSKNPDDRMQTAHDVALELRRIGTELQLPVPAQRQVKSPSRTFVWSLIVIAVAALGLTGLRLWTGKRQHQKQTLRRFSISLPDTAPLAAGPFEKLAVSPDGTQLAYVGGADPPLLHLYLIETMETRPLLRTEGARGPFFSPDGRWIGFYTADGEMKKVSVEGGAPTTVSIDRNLRGATWGPENQIIFTDLRSPLRRVSASGGPVTDITEPDPETNVRWPVMLPDGEHVLYTASDFSGDYENAQLVVRSLKTGETRVVLRGATYGRYLNTRHLVYFHDGTLFVVPFDLATLTVTDTPTPVVTDVDFYFHSGLAHFAVSSDSTLFFIPRNAAETNSEVVWVDRSGTVTSVSPVRRPYDAPRLSPDGRQLVITVGPYPSDLWLYEFERDTWTRLTTEAFNAQAIWSPGGNQIAFGSNRDRRLKVHVMPVDKTAAPRPIRPEQVWAFPTSWSRDGTRIAFEQQEGLRQSDVVVHTVDRSDPLRAVAATNFYEADGAFSPDGQWIAYSSDESGRAEIYVQRYPGPGRRWQISNGGGTHPLWRTDGQEIFYRNGDSMLSVDLKTSGELVAGKPRILFSGNFEEAYDVTADGKRFVMVRLAKRSPQTRINVALGVAESGSRVRMSAGRTFLPPAASDRD